MYLSDLLGLEDVDVESGDFGVLFKKDGMSLGFGDPETAVEMVDLYGESPVAMMMLVSVLVSNSPVGKECRLKLADELVRQMNEDDDLPVN